MEQRELYSDAFMIVWEQIEEEGIFSETERGLGYEPVKAKIYNLIEAGDTDPRHESDLVVSGPHTDRSISSARDERRTPSS